MRVHSYGRSNSKSFSTKSVPKQRKCILKRHDIESPILGEGEGEEEEEEAEPEDHATAESRGFIRPEDWLISIPWSIPTFFSFVLWRP